MLQIAVLNIVTVCGAAAQTPAYVPPAPVQPLPFSHKAHLAKGLTCGDCHTMPEPGDRATFPATARCMACQPSITKSRRPFLGSESAAFRITSHLVTRST